MAIDGEESGSSDRFYFLGLQNHCRWWVQPWNEKMLAPWKKSYDKLSILKNRDITLLTSVHIVEAMVLSVVIYRCESWTIKKADCQCFQIVVLEKTLESLLDSNEIKPVNPKGNQPWIFIGRTNPEAEAPILWPPDAKSWIIGKDPDAGKDWRQEEKGIDRKSVV